ncbi:MAG: phenylacetate-CoA oxygenase subunit PaaC [Ignavibacteriae bacterium]|nr:phenylacetate-CoA oxygenase subunit PaaC [Ignavibacteriota bacterium]
MSTSDGIPTQALETLLLALADDELMLGHRNAEWTGYAPLIEEDIAFSNIAQDELGHSLAWFTLYQQLSNKKPDSLAFEREWSDYTCCRFVTYPKGDFAYTVVRQYLFDEAEQVRLRAFSLSPYEPIRDVSAKILREEAYHLMHSQGLIERLGDATEESHRRMQAALNDAFPQALGMFEALEGEDELISSGIFGGNAKLRDEWLGRVQPVLENATLLIPGAPADFGGRKRNHVEYLQQLVDDLQSVYKIAPGAKW